MQRVCENDSVTIVYDGLLSTGEKFDSSQDTGPLQFQLGTGSVLPAFEQAVLGMAAQETKSITVAAKDAYGLKNEDLIMTVPRQGFADQAIAPGMIVGMDMEQDGQQHKIPATVLSVEAETMTVDFNHPLAGQDIIYQITLLSIDTEAPASTGCGCATGSSDNKGGCTPNRGCGCA
ncbi:FKBP-type peptidyl-prolyl cis-trans isomerase [Thiovibrio frasassiensis]|jgi:peptidylprolyl isomerase|uniref:Peptidyl-prolyl cis-trans isomerase n=1 Tax=Thiovibrio frasassiensis TaxID=2984131 RepID=A0A9X4MGW6_9BACT|nr:peptidylprolyl isomerase [Thiovibrio frasassiensis]MDG4476111.1 peptidylprolyl isomerase [Thiovibrio frasassiensis]